MSYTAKLKKFLQEFVPSKVYDADGQAVFKYSDMLVSVQIQLVSPLFVAVEGAATPRYARPDATRAHAMPLMVHAHAFGLRARVPIHTFATSSNMLPAVLHS